ncbi:acetyltransferase [Gammaproteobacteria bacterium]|nr:acetyltransferase [Gammaproteobacteria bacterium]
MIKPVLIIGGGGHAKVLLEMLRGSGTEVLGIISTLPVSASEVFDNLMIYSSDSDVLSFDHKDVLLVNGVGSLPGNGIRHEIHRKFKTLGYTFGTVIAPSAIVSKYAKLHEGVQIFPGAVVNAGADIGESTIVNTRAVIDHDCELGAFNHIAPGAVLSGGVVSGVNVHIGPGAVLTQSVEIGRDSFIGAGTSVVKDIAARSVVIPSAVRLRARVKDE